MFGKAGRLLGVLGMVWTIAPGCALTQNSSMTEGRYVFQHSMLNFSRVPEFPKRFDTPEPMSSEPSESVAVVESDTNEAVDTDENTYVVGAWRAESQNTISDVKRDNEQELPTTADSRMGTEAVLDLKTEDTPAKSSVESKEEPIQLADAGGRLNDELNSILGGRAEEVQEEEASEPLSLAGDNGFRAQIRDTAMTYLGVQDAYDEGAFVSKVLSVNAVSYTHLTLPTNREV